MRICVACPGAPTPVGCSLRCCRPGQPWCQPGRCMVIRWGLVVMLSGPAPVHGGCREGGRSWMPDQGPSEVQFFFLICPGAVPLFNLIEPDPRKCSHLVPPVPLGV